MDMQPRTKWHDLFYRCPGAWYGSMDGDPKHITVDQDKAVAAIYFLRRHGLVLVGIKAAFATGGLHLTLHSRRFHREHGVIVDAPTMVG